MIKNTTLYKICNWSFKQLHAITSLQIMSFIFWSAEFAYISKIRLGEIHIIGVLSMAILATIACKYIINCLNR